MSPTTAFVARRGARLSVMGVAVFALLCSMLVALAPLARADGCIPAPGRTTCDVGTSNPKPPPTNQPTDPNGGVSTPRPPGESTGGSSDGLGEGNVDWIRYGSTKVYALPSQKSSVPAVIGSGPTFMLNSVSASFAASGCGRGEKTDWGAYVGVKVVQSGLMKDDLSNMNGRFKWQQVSVYTCLKPAKYKDTRVTCAYSAGAKAEGPFNNPNTPSRVLLNSGPVLTAFVKNGMKSLAQCTAGFRQSFSVKTSDYGRYKMTATGTATACVYRDYYAPNERTGVQPADTIVGCSGQFPFAVAQAKWQLFCPKPGWSADWSGSHSFTTQECLASSNPTWTCGPQVNQFPTYAGASAKATVSVIDDGKNRLAQWSTPVPTGVKNLRDKSFRLDYLSGTPFRTGKSAGADTQPFVTTPKADSWATGFAGASTAKGKSGANINFQASGLPGQPWKAQPQWRFTGDFTVKQVTVTSVDWRTGAMTTSVTNVTKTMSATCTGQPISIDAKRARITN